MTGYAAGALRSELTMAVAMRRGCSSDERLFADRRNWGVQLAARELADLLDRCGPVRRRAARDARAFVLVLLRPEAP